MKLSTLEEYGLRCLLHLAQQEPGHSPTIQEISQAEGISPHNVAKILRLLRQHGFAESERGQHGGYSLSLPPDRIIVGDVLTALGGRLYEPSFCDNFTGNETVCLHSSAQCSVRALWGRLQQAVDQVLTHITLRDLLHYGQELHPITSDVSGQLLDISSTP